MRVINVFSAVAERYLIQHSLKKEVFNNLKGTVPRGLFMKADVLDFFYG